MFYFVVDMFFSFVMVGKSPLCISVTVRLIRTTQINAPNTTQEQLDVAIPATTANDKSIEATELSQTATSQEIRGEHSLEPLTLTSIVNLLEDEGPYAPEGVATPEMERIQRDELSHIVKDGHP